MSFRQIKKLIETIGFLSQPGGASLEYLIKNLGVQERQVYRILDSIQDDFLFDIEREKTESGAVRYRLRENIKKLSDIKLADINLTVPEIIALYFLKSNSSVYRDTEVEKHINRAFSKLDAFLPDDFDKKLQKIRSLFISPSLFPKDYSDKDEIIENITASMLQQKTCMIEYNSFARNRVTYFRIDPLSLFERNGGLYIFIRATKFRDIRLIALERILSVTVTDESFIYPDDFKPEEWLENSFGLSNDDPVSLKIRFDSDQAKYIRERKWSKKQQIEDLPDGSVILSLETSGWYYVRRWILSFGNSAELIEPADKRAEMRSIAVSMASGYSE